MEKIIEKERAVLYLPKAQQCRFRFSIESKMNRQTRSAALAAQRFMQRVISKEMLLNTHVRVVIEKTLEKNDGYYLAGTRTMFLGQNSGTFSFVHEAGHHLESCKPDFQKAGLEWRNEKTKGGKLLVGSETGRVKWKYLERTDGVRQKTHLDRYMMRVYPNDVSHEINSVGLEKLYNSPYDLLEKDPSHFELIVKGISHE